MSAADATVDLRGTRIVSEVGKWLLNDNHVTVVIGERGHLGPAVSNSNFDFVICKVEL